MENWKGGFLYRYRSWDKFAKKLLLDGEFYYASFQSLNDPNEGKNISDSLIKNILENDVLLSEEPTEIKDYVKKVITASSKNPDIFKSFKEAIKDHLKEIGVVCCTTKHDNNPMWHFYADENKGICIEFYFPESYSKQYEYLCPCPINYNILDHTGDKSAELLVFNKDSDWSYEKEFRLVARNLKNDISRVHKFPIEKMLCSVIAGHNMSNDDFNELKDIIDQVNKKYDTKVTLHKRLSSDYGIVAIESIEKWDRRHQNLGFIESKKLV